MQKLTVILLSIALFACNAQSTQKDNFKSESPAVTSSHADTTKVQAIFKVGSFQLDTVFKVTRDTFMISSVDSATGTAKMEKRKFVLYYVPILVDTAKKQYQWFGYTPDFVQEVHVRAIIGK